MTAPFPLLQPPQVLSLQKCRYSLGAWFVHWTSGFSHLFLAVGLIWPSKTRAEVKKTKEASHMGVWAISLHIPFCRGVLRQPKRVKPFRKFVAWQMGEWLNLGSCLLCPALMCFLCRSCLQVGVLSLSADVCHLHRYHEVSQMHPQLV